jgi:hypothetical protein
MLNGKLRLFLGITTLLALSQPSFANTFSAKATGSYEGGAMGLATSEQMASAACGQARAYAREEVVNQCMIYFRESTCNRALVRYRTLYSQLRDRYHFDWDCEVQAILSI